MAIVKLLALHVNTIKSLNALILRKQPKRDEHFHEKNNPIYIAVDLPNIFKIFISDKFFFEGLGLTGPLVVTSFYFNTPWKHQKTSGFLMLFKDIEIEHWFKMRSQKFVSIV